MVMKQLVTSIHSFRNTIAVIQYQLSSLTSLESWVQHQFHGFCPGLSIVLFSMPKVDVIKAFLEGKTAQYVFHCAFPAWFISESLMQTSVFRMTEEFLQDDLSHYKCVAIPKTKISAERITALNC